MARQPDECTVQQQKNVTQDTSDVSDNSTAAMAKSGDVG